MTTTLYFAHFRDGPGGAMCRRLGLEIVDDCQSWEEFTRIAVLYNDKSEGRLVQSASALFGVASHGERPLIQAILVAADFAWLADELAEGEAWRQTESTSGRHRLALAACLARIDTPL